MENTYDREARWAKKYREGTLPAASYIRAVNVTIPEDIERRELHAPCFMCGAARECRHRTFA